MVELCAIHHVISYPDFVQIVQVINVSGPLSDWMQNMDLVSQPSLSVTQSQMDCQCDPEMMSKYIPQYRAGTQYNFSDARGFQTSVQSVSEQQGKRALRILVDFMKTETMKSNEATYEPLLSQLIANKS